MKSIVTTVAASFYLFSPASFAEVWEWSEREICRAAAKTYFFLDKMPADAPDSGDYFGFLSTKGNVYTCLIRGDEAHFRWINKSGDVMTSQSTKYVVTSKSLVVTTDMKVERFFGE